MKILILIFFFEIKESKITRGHNFTLVKKQSRLDVIKFSFSQRHTCQVLRFRRSHYGFPEKLKTTAVVRNDYGFTLGWGCTFLVTI